MLFGYDGGFGQWKIVSSEKERKGESLIGNIALVDDIENEVMSNLDNSYYVKFKGQKYIVGKDAIICSSNAHRDTGEDRNKTEELIKLLTALSVATDNLYERIELLICLPLSSFHSRREEYETFLKGSFSIEIWNNYWVKKHFDIIKVKVLLQGVASVYDFVLDNNGEIKENPKAIEILTSRIAVVDPGYKTTEVVVLDNMKYDSNYDLPLERVGIKEGYARLVKELAKNKKTMIVKQIDDMPAIVRKGYVEIPNEVDISDLIDVAFSDIAVKIESHMQSTLGDFRNFKCVLVIGGGGNILYDKFNKIHAATNTYLAPNAEMCNARGAFKYGQLLKLEGRF